MATTATGAHGALTAGTEFLLTNGDGFSRAIARAWLDEAFKARLFSNTGAALSELGVNVPKGLNFRIIEETRSNTLTFILPDPPEDAKTLSQEDLEDIARKTVLFLSTINAISKNSNS